MAQQSILINKLISIRGNSEATPDEREIVDMIIAALDQGILSNASRALNERYFVFIFSDEYKGRRGEYEVCFLLNPDKKAHPRAERAIKASDFVERLTTVIKLEYNCFIVPSAVEVLPQNVIKSRFFPTQQVEVTLSGEIDGGSRSAVPDNSLFELEVDIIANRNQKCKIINDTIVARMTTVNGKSTLSFEHAMIDHRATDNKLIISDNDIKLSVQQANKLFKLINGDDMPEERRSENKIKILEALQSSDRSEFSKYLRAPESGGENMGQIRIRPHSIFINAITQRTYQYKITEDGDSYYLNITWDKKSDEFDMNTPLYVVAKNGKFEGFTSQNIGGRLETYRKGDRLVPYYSIKKGKSVCEGITLIPQAGNAPYKSVNEIDLCLVTKASDGYKTFVYYLKDDVTLINNEAYITEDCEKCAYDEDLYWKGDLTEESVSFVSKTGKTLKSGKVNKKYKADKAMARRCAYCGNTYIADNKRYQDYSDNHRLIDGTIYCDNCKKDKIVTVSGKRRLLIDDVTHSQSRSSGKLYAIVDSTKKLISPAAGGNTFTCGDCKKTIWYVQGQDYVCDCCGTRLCYSCKFSSKGNKVVYDPARQEKVFTCNSCPDPGDATALVNGMPIKKIVYPVLSEDGKEKKNILDDAKSPQYIYHCGICREEVFYNPNNPKHRECECCGRYIDPKCFMLLKPTPHINKKLCLDCQRKLSGGDYLTSLDKYRSEIKALTDQREYIQRIETELKNGWSRRVLGDINRYLPYLGFFDRVRIKKLIKGKKTADAIADALSRGKDIRVSISQVAVYSESEYYVHFAIWVGTTSYSFVNESDKIITEGGHY